jgi:hypothetical protein
MKTYRGSCLCGSVRYEVTGRFPRIVHCHCQMCRKVQGAAFASYSSAHWISRWERWTTIRA